MADLLKFTPKDRQGDPDFPGIPALAHFYKPPATTQDGTERIDWDRIAEERLGQRPPRTTGEEPK